MVVNHIVQANYLGVCIDKKAGFTSNVSFFDTSIPEKYWFLNCWFTPISSVNCPIGYLPKSISIEKINEVVGMYRAVIDFAPLKPFTI
jgi:hypothetical protein